MSQKLKEPKVKKGRRGNNEGCIYQRKDGRWCGQVIIGFKTDGKPIRKTLYGSSRKEVAKKVATMVGKVFTEGYVSVSAEDERNLQILMQGWFDVFVAPGLASITVENRHNMLKNHIFKAFGKYSVQDVTAEMLQKFVNNKIEAGTAHDSVGKMKNLLKNFFAYVCEKGFVQKNPMLNVKILRSDDDSCMEDKENVIREELRQDVFSWAMQNTILKPIILTFTLTGLRPQELIALEWRHVSLIDKSISIKQALRRKVKLDSEYNVIERSEKIGKTKTPTSVREFLMPDVVVAALHEWKDYCIEKDINSKYVFPTQKGGMRTYSGLRSLLVRFIEKHGLEDEGITLYTFRHTFATVLLEQREHPKIVASLMGHKRVSTTLDIYSHVVNRSVYKETAQTLDGAWATMTRTD